MESHLILCLRLLLAAVLGGAFGLERELAGKPAGLRTNPLIAHGGRADSRRGVSPEP